MKAHQTDFSTGSVYRNILDVGLPMTLAQVLNLLYNIVDRIYIGRIPGQGALALTGVGLCFPIITMIAAFANLFGLGGGPLCAIARGEGDDEEAERVMGTSFTALLVCGAALTVAGLVFHRPILYAFGASDVTYPFARDYVLIYLIGTLFVMVTLGMNPFINSQGFGRVGMLTVLLGAVANILLDPLFIFVFGMGVRGAALATILSQLLGALWVLRFLTGGDTELRLRLEAMRVRWRRLKRILSLGLTGFTMGFTTALVQIVCNTTVQRLGGDLYVGVMTVINSVREIVQLPVMGMNNGASPVLSYNYGERAYDRVKKGIFFAVVTGTAYTLVAWLAIFTMPEVFIRIFNSDPDLIAAGVPSLRIYFFGFFGMALQLSAQSVFVSLGKARQAVFFSLFRKVIIVVPLTLILPRFWGLGINGVFVAEPVSNIVGGGVCFATMLLTVLPELNRSASPPARASNPARKEHLPH